MTKSDNGPTMDCLTMRERQILNSLLQGQTAEEMSEKYGITRTSANAFKTKIRAKMGVATDLELMELALKKRWVKKLPDPDIPVAYTTVEAAAGPQARFIVGTLDGSEYFRFERRIKRKLKLAIYTEKYLDCEYTTGYKGIHYGRLTEFRRVYPTRYLCDLDRVAACDKDVHTVPFRDGFCLVFFAGQRNAATLRLSRQYIRETLDDGTTNAAFEYMTRRDGDNGSNDEWSRPGPKHDDQPDNGTDAGE